jgi:Spondin_N
MKFKPGFVLGAGLVAASLFYSMTATAQALVYSYEGNNFDLIEFQSDLFTTDDRVTASFRLDCAAAHQAATCQNLPYDDYYLLGAITLEPMDFSAGPAALPTAEGDFEVARFLFSTDAQGRIVDWDIDLFLNAPGGIINVDTDNVGGGIDSAAAQGGGASLLGNPGTWTVAAPGPVTYKVTIANWTAGQILSPPLVVTHSGNYTMFKPTLPASDGLERLAESGETDLLVSEEGDDFVDAVTANSPVEPGRKVSVSIVGAPNEDFISMAAMLVYTNDTIVGITRLRLPFAGSVSRRLYAYDAGTEENTQSCQHIPGPYCGGEGYSVEQGEGFVSISSGLHGTGGQDDDGSEILDARVFDWGFPAARITITRVPYEGR